MMGKMVKVCGGIVVLAAVVVGAAMAEGKNEATYEKDVKKIVAARCLACHGSNAPTIEEFNKDKEGFKGRMKGPRMDTYSNLMIFVNGSDTGALMRRLDDGKNTKDGKPGNMYKYLGGADEEKGENLDVIKKWVGGWTLKRKNEIAENELKAIVSLEK